MIGLIKPEICTKMRKKLSEELRAKFPATTRGYSMVKIASLDDTFLEVFWSFLTASKPSRRSVTAVKRKKGDKGKAKKKTKSLQ